MGKKKLFFQRNNVSYEPNIYIGGVGASYITSKEDFANITTLDVADIKYFKIDANNNVAMFIDSVYIKSLESSFLETSTITYLVSYIPIYLEKGGVNGLNLTYVYASFLKSVIEVGYNSTKLTHANLDTDITTFPKTFISTKLKRLTIPTNYISQTNVQRYGFQHMYSLRRLDLRKITSMHPNVSRLAVDNGSLSMFRSLSNCKIYYNPSLGVKDRSAYLFVGGDFQVGDQVRINGLNYYAVSGTPTNESEFNAEGDRPYKNLRAFSNCVSADTRVGLIGDVKAYESRRQVVYTTTTGTIANTVDFEVIIGNLVEVEFSYFQGGHDVDWLLQNKRNWYNCEIIECGDPIPVNAPLSLNLSNITTTTVDLNFTIPTPNANGNDGYEVWVEDITIYRKLLAYNEITDSGDTLDLSEVVNDINGKGTLSGVKIRIRTIDGQYNFSPFSNEVTIN